MSHTPPTEISTRVVRERGGLASCLGELAAELGAKRALIVTDPGVAAAGYAQTAIAALTGRGIATAIFTGVPENPAADICDEIATNAREFGADLLVGLGGGSAIDAAKGANFLIGEPGPIARFWRTELPAPPMLPLIAIPTTAGTGSEVQRFALISDPQTHKKMAIGRFEAAPKVALLDPTLTATAPKNVTAHAGIDALVHAVEAFATRIRTELSASLARDAFALLNGNFERVLENPGDLDAREAMQNGACLSGMAIELSMLGAAHAAANPLTARFGIVHGQAVGAMLPHIVRFNAQIPETAKLYDELFGSAELLARRLVHLLERARLATNLSDLSIPADAIPALAADAALEWTGTFNPRPVATDDFKKLYENAL